VTPFQEMRVELGPRSYEILVGETLLAKAGQHIAEVIQRPKVVLISDETVAALHMVALEKSLRDAEIAVDTVVVPAGEQTKSLRELEALTDRLLQIPIERSDTLIALGGGVVGDLVGFAAAITLRGIDFVQVPTTLLAQVDSSVGGKTGINTKWGKNLIGAFHQPRLVLADTEVLETLPRRELLAGYAEVVKYALIGDPEFFAWLEGHAAHLVEGDPAALQHAVLTSCQAKAKIVAEDERESGKRALLNLGHTFAHALEAETGYGSELLHGEAVAIGQVLAFELSAQLGLCPAEDAARVRRHFATVELPTGLESVQGRMWDANRLISHMGRDKKVKDGKITFVLTEGIGKAYLDNTVDLNDVRALLISAAAA